MKLLKWMFSIKSPSKKYYKELILTGCIILCFILLIIFIDQLELLDALWMALSGISIFLFFVLIFISLMRFIDILDYNEKLKIKIGKFKFQYKPVNYNIEEILRWVKHTREPDTLFIKGKKETLIIEVGYETKGKNGPFTNKKIYFNEDLINDIDALRNKIYDKCEIVNNLVLVYAITEFNDPKLFANILNNLNKE